jgi:hypothetical protein
VVELRRVAAFKKIIFPVLGHGMEDAPVVTIIKQ